MDAAQLYARGLGQTIDACGQKNKTARKQAEQAPDIALCNRRPIGYESEIEGSATTGSCRVGRGKGGCG